MGRTCNWLCRKNHDPDTCTSCTPYLPNHPRPMFIETCRLTMPSVLFVRAGALPGGASTARRRGGTASVSAGVEAQPHHEEARRWSLSAVRRARPPVSARATTHGATWRLTGHYAVDADFHPSERTRTMHSFGLFSLFRVELELCLNVVISMMSSLDSLVAELLKSCPAVR